MYAIAKTAVCDNRRLIVAGIAAFAALCYLLLSQQRLEQISSGVAIWWTLLCAVGVINVCAWHRSAAALARRKPGAEPAYHALQRWQLLLCAVFVLGCGFRSILPRGDVQRIGLIDSWLSSVLVGRSVATVAELCFMAQWALLLHHIAKNAGSRAGVFLSWCIVPLIAVAELCSWHAVLTTCYLGNAIEESIWAVTASLLLAGCLALWSQFRTTHRAFLAAALVFGLAYVTFMCTVDVPMYVARWQADVADGRPYLSLSQGVQDAWSRRVVTFAWDEWRTEIPWMSLYFSVAVWWSLALVHAPDFRPRRRREDEQRLNNG